MPLGLSNGKTSQQRQKSPTRVYDVQLYTTQRLHTVQQINGIHYTHITDSILNKIFIHTV